VYLEPLVDDLKTLWSEGIDAYNGYKREPFILRGLLLCTVTDVPGGHFVSEQCKGEKDYAHCLDDIEIIWLNNSKKQVYMRHRRFLPKSHAYRNMKCQFDGTREIGDASRNFNGLHVFNQVKYLPTAHGKKGENAIK
jgi:hypothetical protein